MLYSVVVPVFNEEGNVEKLYSEISSVMNSYDYEILFDDDGSSDKTYSILEALHKKDAKLKVLQFRKNFGQSAAMDAGFHSAKGDIIITMDGDLQNDPKDIPLLLKKLDEGYDAVSGWRWKRKDRLEKKLFSLMSRRLRNIVIRDNLHDSGCSLKVYKKECFEDFSLTGEMHRYIAELLVLRGFKVGEVKVNHRARESGKTKYSMSRVLKGFLDLSLVWFWQKYVGRPLHLFGSMGVALIGLGVLSFIYVFTLWVMNRIDLSDHFLSIVSVFLIVLGVQFFVSGIMADLLVKNYYKDKKRYTVRSFLK